MVVAVIDKFMVEALERNAQTMKEFLGQRSNRDFFYHLGDLLHSDGRTVARDEGEKEWQSYLRVVIAIEQLAQMLALAYQGGDGENEYPQTKSLLFGSERLMTPVCTDRTISYSFVERLYTVYTEEHKKVRG